MTPCIRRLINVIVRDVTVGGVMEEQIIPQHGLVTQRNRHMSAEEKDLGEIDLMSYGFECFGCCRRSIQRDPSYYPRVSAPVNLHVSIIFQLSFE